MTESVKRESVIILIIESDFLNDEIIFKILQQLIQNEHMPLNGKVHIQLNPLKIQFYKFLNTQNKNLVLISYKFLLINLNQEMFQILRKIVVCLTVIKMFAWLSFVGLVKSYAQVKNASRTEANWVYALFTFLKLKIKKIASQYEIRKQRTIFLINHRSQADFFLHALILGARTNFIARRQVAVLFGITALFVTKVVWFFKRSGNIEIQKFNTWLDKKYSQTPFSALIVYPEGHRMYGTKKVQKQKIKHGMIKYAYTRGIPVQFIMSFGNQNAFNEQKLQIGYGQQIKYKIGCVIDPKQYEQAGQFINTVVEQFSRFFVQTAQNCDQNFQTNDTTKQLLQALQFKAE